MGWGSLVIPLKRVYPFFPRLLLGLVVFPFGGFGVGFRA